MSNREHLPYEGPQPDYDPANYIADQKTPIPGRERLGAPEGAPNVLLILIDDMGFGASSAFGGPCHMPAAEKLAEGGLRYSRFHTTALCSPTRAALMSGRNHHTVGMGSVVEMATGTPGNHMTRPRSAGTIAQTLNYNGYATAAFGKWHMTPGVERAPGSHFDHWPTHEGFDKFYGIVHGGDNQFAPHLHDGITPIDPPKTPEEGYHLSEDLVDQAIDWVDEVRTFNPDKPWFTYLAFGATHSPFHVPEDWKDRYRGKFSHGWDKQREITFARQKELGLVPEDAELGPWAEGLPHWDEVSDDARTVAERLMEMYAAFAEHTDTQVKRLVDFLEERGELDNTLVIYILGDNGASAEGTRQGVYNEILHYNGIPESLDDILEKLDEIGGPDSFPNYPVSWAVAMNTPYQWTKQIASHYGGTRTGTIVHWPQGAKAKGEVRNQWHHVIDVAPTIFEAAGVPHPKTIDGVEQQPIEGTSFLYSLNDPEAPDRHTTQYFEMHGSRGIYHEGWTAVTRHRTPWFIAGHKNPSLDEDVWELYDTNSDWTQARNLADEYPEKLAELKELFLVEARKHNVLPIDDRMLERWLPELAGRETRTEIRLTPQMKRLYEEALPNLKNVSYSIKVEFVADSDRADGVLIAQGGRYTGWSIYLKEGVPVYVLNIGGRYFTYIRGEERVSLGSHVLDYRFIYDGGGLGKGGDGILSLDGHEIARGRFERTVGFMYSPSETTNLGLDTGTPVTPDYSRGAGNPLIGGRIIAATLKTGDDAIEPSDEDRLRVAVAID